MKTFENTNVEGKYFHPNRVNFTGEEIMPIYGGRGGEWEIQEIC
jgi:hypothetical protein